MIKITTYSERYKADFIREGQLRQFSNHVFWRFQFNVVPLHKSLKKSCNH